MNSGTEAGRPKDDGHPSLGRSPILVGVDWSEGARHALEWTALIARSSGSPVTLLHSIPFCNGLQTVSASDLERHRTVVTGSVDRWAERLDGLRHDTRVLDGDPAVSILTVAGEISPGLIIVGSHGAGRFSSRLLGSVATKVLHTTKGPVAIVPRSARVDSIQGNLVVGVDGSPSSLRATDWAAHTGAILGVGVYLVCTYPADSHAERPNLSDADGETAVEDSLEVLRKLTSEMAEETGTLVSSDVLIGEPGRRLIEAARGDLALVLGSTGQSSPPDSALGSTSRYAATHASVPVVIVT
jgi:nucleotide-binding universal stress UspA family protein